MVTDLRMGVVHTAVEFTIKNDSTSDPGPNRHINQASLVSSWPPSCFSLANAAASASFSIATGTRKISGQIT